MPAPWDSLVLIELNLTKIATLRVGEKIGQPDPSTGHFKISTNDSGRTSADSITRMAPLLRRFLKRAILVASCDEFKKDPYGPGGGVGVISGLLRAVVSIGLSNLRSTYSRDSMFNRKTDQRRAVDELVAFIQREMPRMNTTWMKDKATAAFNVVRGKYKAGYKSDNKRYAVTPNGKYSTATALGVGSKDPKTFNERELRRRRANQAIGEQRLTRRAEGLAKDLGQGGLNQEITSVETSLNQIVAAMLGAGTTYRSLGKQAVDGLRAAIKAIDADMAKVFIESCEDLVELDKARIIFQTNAAPADPWMARAGNCGELAELAHQRMERVHLPFICQARLSTRDDHFVDGHQGDHVFTIFGLHLINHLSDFSHPNPPVLLEPKDRTHLRSAWIIDPWVNLCCRIDEYPSRFWAKMREWSGNGKQIRVGGAWINPDPLSNSWYARTIFELDWEIREYRTYDGRVFADEELQQQAMQQPVLLL